MVTRGPVAILPKRKGILSVSSLIPIDFTMSSKGKRQNKTKGTQMTGPLKQVSSRSVAAAHGTVVQNPTYMRLSDAPAHNDFGVGVRISGRQYLTSITGDASTGIFSGNSPASVNEIYLSPDAINGRAALIARTYNRYAFRKARIYYESTCPTTINAGFALAYSSDSAITSFGTASYTTIQSFVPCVVTPFREDACLEIAYKGDLTWLVELDNSSSSALRLTAQGEFIGYASASASNNGVNLGNLMIEFVLDLYQPSLDYGFSVSVSSSEYELVKSYLKKVRDTEQFTHVPSPVSPSPPQITGRR